MFAIASPKILGGATNQIVEDYVSMKAYETITSKLPNGASLPAGTTGADVLNRLPNCQKLKAKFRPTNLIPLKAGSLASAQNFTLRQFGESLVC